MSKLNSREELRELAREKSFARQMKSRCVTVCSGTGCLAADAAGCARALAAEIARRDGAGQLQLRQTGCFGFCERGPVVVVEPGNTAYLEVKPADAGQIVAAALAGGPPVERLLYHDPDGRPVERLEEIPFYQHQQRLLLEANTLVDPRSIDDSIAIGGYGALARVLFEMSPEAVIEEIRRSGLRGRGGGGFPTGVKWQTTRDSEGDVKYVIVNADEGDPGAYMDRSLLDGNPHAVIEGLAIGAFAVGAREGFIYVRQEYPLAVENTRIALAQARERGLLGRDILGSGFDFEVTIHRGAGAFASGESSALMSAIEGQVGVPRPKYIHTSVKGLWDRPTCLNNVETWANVPLILSRGADWFRGLGTEGSPGTKVFSLVGRVVNSGLVEVPMGISLRDIIFKIGGGVPDGRRFKAVQTGGPSGGFLPESQLDLQVDFDQLTRAGSMMGSGGMIVMDEDTCIVDTVRFYVNFLAHESCGTCIPCREGLRQMLKILDRIVAGHGRMEDLDLLEELAELLREASLCALGASAANPVLSGLRYFRSEFEAHIRERRCPAGVCTGLFHYEVDSDSCSGCGLCKRACPTDAIQGEPRRPHWIDQERCVKCGGCLRACPERVGALTRVPGPAARPAAIS